MATYAKRGTRWRAQVRLKGVSDSESFRTKQEAIAWATAREAAILRGEQGFGPTTLKTALEAFLRDETPKRRGKRWEAVRIAKFLSDTEWRRKRIPFLYVPLKELQPKHFATFRDERLREVSAGSVLRELALFSGVLEWARLEKRWIYGNPIHDITKPSAPPARKRIFSDEEVRRILLALGYEGGKPSGPSQEVALIFLIALETGMRSGEIVGMTWENLNLKDGVAHVEMSKNSAPRDVPMLPSAVALWKRMKGTGRVFSISDASRDVLFRKATKAAEVKGATFHDSRATALTKLSRMVDVMTLSRISGHRDINLLVRVYYRERPEQISARLAAVASGESLHTPESPLESSGDKARPKSSEPKE